MYFYFFSECKKCDVCDCKENQKEWCNKSNGKCVCLSKPTSGSSATFTFNKTIVLSTAFLIFLSHQFWKKKWNYLLNLSYEFTNNLINSHFYYPFKIVHSKIIQQNYFIVHHIFDFPFTPILNKEILIFDKCVIQIH